MFPNNFKMFLRVINSESRNIRSLSQLFRRQTCLINSEHLSQLSQSNNQASVPPKNESILDYANPQSEQRVELEKCLGEFLNTEQEIPIIINGEEYKTDLVKYQSIPFEHGKKIAKFFYADIKLIKKAIKASLDARDLWQSINIKERCDIMRKAAELASGKYRQLLNASTMLGQAKTIKQAEIDSACELSDFLRFNAYYAEQLIDWQTPRSTEFETNSLKFRALDGFVAAISPFNFTAIGANLASAPTLMGSCTIWKPSDTAMLSNYIVMKIFLEAGLPDGVINFVPSEGLEFGRTITANHQIAGINFTGSLETFRWLWCEVGMNIRNYDTFPRLIGECGGKNYHLIHQSAHLETALAQTIRSAFEYSGQKCSACSRLYVPQSLWIEGKFKHNLIDIAANHLKIGPATDFGVYSSALIDSNAYERVKSYIKFGNCSSELSLLCGGNYSDEVGYFVEPTIFETSNPNNLIMHNEVFGPILTVYPYAESELDSILNLINSNKFALTGSIFAQDENFISEAKEKLKMSAGNFYINDKSTGAVVGQQPFGGSKNSGTNDKAGGPHYLMRWCNQQTIKRTHKHLVDY